MILKKSKMIYEEKAKGAQVRSEEKWEEVFGSRET